MNSGSLEIRTGYSFSCLAICSSLHSINLDNVVQVCANVRIHATSGHAKNTGAALVGITCHAYVEWEAQVDNTCGLINRSHALAAIHVVVANTIHVHAACTIVSKEHTSAVHHKFAASEVFVDLVAENNFNVRLR